MEKKQHNAGTMGKVMTGVGLAALAATAAGAIFLYGSEAGKKRRKEIRSWMLRMKGDVMDQMEKMKDWSEDSYNTVIHSVADKYEKMKKVDPIELATIVRDLKGHWKNLKRHVETSQKPAKKRTSAKRKAPKSDSKSE